MKTEMPDPHDMWVVNNVGMGTKETMLSHLAGIRVMAEAKTPYEIEFSPMDEQWMDIVMNIGTWVRGPSAEVKRFLSDWSEEAGKMGISIAPYINR